MTTALVLDALIVAGWTRRHTCLGGLICHTDIFKMELDRNPSALTANGGPWRGLDDLEIATCEWASWFNEERLHSELGDKTPEEFEAEFRHNSQPDAA